MKILSQLRPRRVVIVRGSPESTATIQNHCQENIDARVFAPNRGEVVDATTETHIYQVRLTDALVSQLNFQKAKDAEVAWVNAEIVVRKGQLDAKRMNVDNEPMDGKGDKENKQKILTVIPKVYFGGVWLVVFCLKCQNSVIWWLWYDQYDWFEAKLNG